MVVRDIEGGFPAKDDHPEGEAPATHPASGREVF
jgi:hypothetical protein